MAALVHLVRQCPLVLMGTRCSRWLNYVWSMSPGEDHEPSVETLSLRQIYSLVTDFHTDFVVARQVYCCSASSLVPTC